MPAVEVQTEPFDYNELNEASIPLVPVGSPQHENQDEQGGIRMGNDMLGNVADAPENDDNWRFERRHSSANFDVETRQIDANENRAGNVSGNDSGLGEADYDEDEDHNVPESSPLSQPALTPDFDHPFARSGTNSYLNSIQTLSQQDLRDNATREEARGCAK